MLLSDQDLRSVLAAGSLYVSPFDGKLVQPASLDVRLGDQFRVFAQSRATHIDPCNIPDDLTDVVVVQSGDPFVLHPGQFVLATTLEWIGLTVEFAARLEGKSSLGRLGLLTHSTAGFIDPGFQGNVTLELANVSTLPITLWPGMPIGQLCVFRLETPAQQSYAGRYQNQRGPTASAGVAS